MTTLVGTGSLVRFILRRDRTRLAIWVAVLGSFPFVVAGSFASLYPTAASRQGLVATVASNPGLTAFLGPIHGSSIGDLTTWRIGTIGCLLVGLMAVLTVIRHTRVEEETGRRELIGSTVVGRHAPLVAAMLVAAAAGALVGLLATLGLVGAGESFVGAVAFGVGWFAVSLVFTVLGAVAAQLTESSGAAQGIGVGAVGLAFLLRLAGDGGESSGLGWLSWLSPIGWFSRIRPFADERWWVLVLPIGLAAVSCATAFVLSARRDVAAGVFPPRPGPAEAPAWLRTPSALAWRLQRAALVGWTFGLAVVGLVYGGLGDSVRSLVDDNPQLGEIFERLGGEQALTDAYFSAAFGILALIASAYAIRTALRLRAEEEEMRAEPVLATAAPRARWVGGHVAVALAGSAVMMAVAGLVAGLVHGSVAGDVGGQATRMLGSALLQIPAIWVLVGIAAALFGLLARQTSLAWAALLAFFLLGQLGQILQFPQWSLNLSPFTHIPGLPGEVDPLPLVVLTGIAATLIAAGIAGFRRRDLD